jgi:hypothetical protein
MVIIQMGNLRLVVLALTLAVSLTATAQEHWDSWLSAGTKIYRSPYYFPPPLPTITHITILTIITIHIQYHLNTPAPPS